MNSTERVKATDQIDNILHRILAPKIKMIKKVEIFNFSRENSEFELFGSDFFLSEQVARREQYIVGRDKWPRCDIRY